MTEYNQRKRKQIYSNMGMIKHLKLEVDKHKIIEILEKHKSSNFVKAITQRYIK